MKNFGSSGDFGLNWIRDFSAQHGQVPPASRRQQSGKAGVGHALMPLRLMGRAQKPRD